MGRPSASRAAKVRRPRSAHSHGAPQVLGPPPRRAPHAADRRAPAADPHACAAPGAPPAPPHTCHLYSTPAELLSSEGYNMEDPVVILSFGDVGQTVRSPACSKLALPARCPYCLRTQPVHLECRCSGCGAARRAAGQGKKIEKGSCPLHHRWPTCLRAPPWAAPCRTSCLTSQWRACRCGPGAQAHACCISGSWLLRHSTCCCIRQTVAAGRHAAWRSKRALAPRACCRLHYQPSARPCVFRRHRRLDSMCCMGTASGPRCALWALGILACTATRQTVDPVPQAR